MEGYPPPTPIERIPRAPSLDLSSTCFLLATAFDAGASLANYKAHETNSPKVETVQSSYVTEDFWAVSGLGTVSIATFITTETNAKAHKRDINESDNRLTKGR